MYGDRFRTMPTHHTSTSMFIGVNRRLRSLPSRAAMLLGLALLVALRHPAGAAPRSWGSDPRLDRPVSGAAIHGSLRQALEALGKPLSITLKSSPELADEPVFISGQGRPLRVVLEQLGILLDGEWVPGSESSGYRLMPRKGFARRMEEARALIRRQAKAGVLREIDPTIAGALNDDDEAHLVAAYKAYGRVATFAASRYWEEMLAGEMFCFSTRREPGGILLPRDVADATTPGLSVLDGSAVRVWAGARLWTSPRGWRVQLAIQPREVPLLGQVEVDSLPTWIFEALDTPGTQLMAERDGFSQFSGGSPIQLRLGEPRERDLTGLGAERGWWTGDVLAQIAPQSSLGIVATEYASSVLLPPRGAESGLIGSPDLLRALLNQGMQLAIAEGVLRVSDSNRAYARLQEIPTHLVDSWAAELKKNRRLSLDQAAAIFLKLSLDQLIWLEQQLRSRGVFLDRSATDDLLISATPQALRAYGALPIASRRRLRRGEKVGWAEMPPATRRYLTLAGLNAQYSGDADPGAPIASLWRGTLSLVVDRDGAGDADPGGVRLLHHYAPSRTQEYAFDLPDCRTGTGSDAGSK